MGNSQSDTKEKALKEKALKKKPLKEKALKKKLLKEILKEYKSSKYSKYSNLSLKEVKKELSLNPLVFCIDHGLEDFIKPLIEQGESPQALERNIFPLVFIKRRPDLLEFLFEKGLNLEAPDSVGSLLFFLREANFHHERHLNSLKTLLAIVKKQKLSKENMEVLLITVLERLDFWCTRIHPINLGIIINNILWQSINTEKLQASSSWDLVWFYHTWMVSKTLILLAYYKDEGSLFFKDTFPLDLLKQVFMFLE